MRRGTTRPSTRSSATPAVALSSFPAQRAEWSVYQGKDWGFSHMAIHNATHLTLDLRRRAADATAPLHHSVTIERKYPRV